MKTRKVFKKWVEWLLLGIGVLSISLACMNNTEEIGMYMLSQSLILLPGLASALLLNKWGRNEEI